MPGAPTGVTATAGQASATVSWTAPSGGGAPTSYEVTPYIGATAQTAKTVTGTPPATSTTVTGLAAGTAYTFRVRAANIEGNGPQSAASNAVTPTSAGLPAAPTAVTASPDAEAAVVRWTPAGDGGSALTTYTVTPYVGGVAQADTTVDAPASRATVTGLTLGTSYTFRVRANNANGAGTQSAETAAVSPMRSIFGFAAPVTADGGDGGAVELGVRFQSSQAGTVTGIRFYKAAANTGTHVGTLWSETGVQQARATFTGEGASGWQSVLFSTPVAVTANTTYVASYHAPAGHYSVAGHAFDSVVANPPLTALADAGGGNGLYRYTAAPDFPTSSFNATNYYVDVLYQSGP